MRVAGDPLRDCTPLRACDCYPPSAVGQRLLPNTSLSRLVPNSSQDSPYRGPRGLFPLEHVLLRLRRSTSRDDFPVQLEQMGNLEADVALKTPRPAVPT